MGLSKRQISSLYGLNTHSVNLLVRKGVLTLLPESTPLRPKINPESLHNLVEGVHYVVCQECGAYQNMISTKHLKFCSGMTLGQYRDKYPGSPILSDLASANKAKTEDQKVAQSLKIKERFTTPEGKVTRNQISEASIRLHRSGYREKAAAHLTMINRDPEMRKQRRKETLARWESGELREAVEGWHRENREASLASAAHARNHITSKRTKLHLNFKSAILERGILGFHTEYNVGYYSIDEAHPTLKIAVEVDGCYWHGCSVCDYPGIGDIVSLDKRKTTCLSRRGWRVLRFKEHEIKRDTASCLNRLQHVIAERET